MQKDHKHDWTIVETDNSRLGSIGRLFLLACTCSAYKWIVGEIEEDWDTEDML